MVGSLENLLIIKVIPDSGVISSLTSVQNLCNNYFQLMVPLGAIFLQNILRRTITWVCVNVLVTHTLTQGLGIAGCCLFDLKESNSFKNIYKY